MRIAIAQLNPTVGNLAHNAQQILQAAQQAVAQAAELLITPELSLCGYPPRDLLMQPSFITAIAHQLNALATALPPHLAVLVGTVTVNPQADQAGEKTLHNSVVLLHHGGIQQVFHKHLLPTYDVFDEARYFEPGRQPNILTLAGVKVGISICEDLWNDEEFWGKRHYESNPMQALSAAGVDMVVNLSASPYTLTKPEVRVAMLQHAARRYACPILYTNQVGGNDDLLFDGGSLAVDGTGTVVGRALAFAPDLLCCTWDPQTRRLTSDRLTLPLDQTAAIWSALVLGVRDYARKCGFRQIVLGLSGGIDSALVAAIATAAVGATNVLGVLMPSPYSSDHSITDALALAENLGIRTETIPIRDVMQAFDQTLAPLFAGTEFGVAEENLQSRTRGNVLMAIANKFGYLLLSTGNKSEMAVGYCTLYGDMNGGLAAIADVPKTQVYALCRWLNQVSQTYQPLSRPEAQIPLGLEQLSLGHVIIPTHVITKPPSAELKPGQTDQDSLPDYDTLDDILDRLIHQRQSPAEVVAAGHDEAVVNRVFQLWHRAEFKRRQAPPGLKITDRAFGTGWRMPIASQWSLAATAARPQPV